MYSENRANFGNINNTEVIPIPLVRTIGNSLTYNGGKVTVNEPGTYLAVWTVLVRSNCKEGDHGYEQNDIIIALENDYGSVQYAVSGNIAEGCSRCGISHISGHAAVALNAGDTLVLRNRSDDTIHLTNVGQSVTYSASLSIVKIG